MSPPNNVISHLKDARRCQAVALWASGYLYPGRPLTEEQAAHIWLCHALSVAITIAELIEGDMYDVVFEVMAETETPEPW